MNKKKSSVTLLISILFFLLASPVFAEDTTPIYIGVEPRIGREDWYQDGEYDVNVIPLVIEFALSDNISFKTKTSYFMHYGGSVGSKRSLVGIGGNVFYHFKPISDSRQYHGLFLGPLLESNYDYIEAMRHSTIAAEVGYAIPVDTDWSVNISAQYGRTNFSDATKPTADHFGIFVNFGYWLF